VPGGGGGGGGVVIKGKPSLGNEKSETEKTNGKFKEKKKEKTV